MTNSTRRSFLFWAAGASRDYLGQCPATEHVKYQCIGALVCLTSMAACVSMFTAVSMTWPQEKTGFPTAAIALPVALLWAAFIFVLDRFVVSSMRPHDAFSARMRQAFPRIVLGIVIGVIISRPIEIKIFEDEIRKVLAEDYFGRSKAYDRIVKEKIETKKQSFSLEHVDKQRQLRQLAADLERTITEQQATYDKLYSSVAQLTSAAIDEESGIGPTRQKGQGPRYRGYKQQELEARQLLSSAKAELEATKIKKNDTDRQLSEIERLIDERLKENVHELKKDQQELNRRRAAFDKDGFLDLNVGLSILAGQQPAPSTSGTQAPILSAAAAIGPIEEATVQSSELPIGLDDFYKGSVVREVLWAITIFFILIEIIPVLMKLLTPPGPYDVFLRKEMVSAEEHHIKLMESVRRVRQAFLNAYEETNKSAFDRVFGAIGREFDNLHEGRGRKVFASLWEQIAGRIHATMSRVDSEHERPPAWNEFAAAAVSSAFPTGNADMQVPPLRRRAWPKPSHGTGKLICAGALTFGSVFASAWLLRSYEVALDSSLNISVAMGGLMMTALTTLLTHGSTRGNHQ
jgi:hypothetical protein